MVSIQRVNEFSLADERQTGLIAAGISKAFGTTNALIDVDINLEPGEVHALLGENGAGKSTLVGVLNGSVVPDTGSIRLNGAAVEVGSRRAASGQRIATVYQDLMLIPSMTGLQNIALALSAAPNRETRKHIEAVQKKFELPANLDVAVGELDLPHRQRIELIRALSEQPSVLLLDEPTSYLPPTSVDPFLKEIRRLAAEGIAVLFITHQLREVRGTADRVTVLRRGHVVGRYRSDGLPGNDVLARAMVGADLPEVAQRWSPKEPTVIRAMDLVVERVPGQVAVAGASLAVRESEIVGVAGVDGNGQLELLEALAGLRRVSSGSVLYSGRDVTNTQYVERCRDGIYFVSGDRKRFGIVPTFTVSEHFEYVLGAGVVPRLSELLSGYRVHPARPGLRGDKLSGGNQQKMILARAFEKRPRLLLLAYPTAGLDVQACASIRGSLISRVEQGASVVIASSDLDELLTISHRVIVMNRGLIVGRQEQGRFDRDQLARWFTGDGDE